MLVVIAFESMFGNTRHVAEAVAEGLDGGTHPPRVEVASADRIGQDSLSRADLLVVGGPTHYHGLATRTSIVAGRQLQRRAALTGHPRPRGIDGWGEIGCPDPATDPTGADLSSPDLSTPDLSTPDLSGPDPAAFETAVHYAATAEPMDGGVPAPGWGGPPSAHGRALQGDVDLRAWLRCLPRPMETKAQAAAFDTRVTSRWAGGAAYAIARRLRRHGYHLVVPPEGFLIDGLLGPLRQDERARARMWGVRLRRQISL
jgi:hypothetical protein